MSQTSTFLNLTNQLLQRLNEVELSSVDFNSSRGVQSLAKTAINSAIDQINNSEDKWPFNGAHTLFVMTPGTAEYPWLDNHQLVDWGSFQLRPSTSNPTRLTQPRKLDFIPRDEYLEMFRSRDMNDDNRDIPRMVFPGHTYGFGVSPSPDEAYTLAWSYWQQPPKLVQANDTTTIPSVFDYIIVDGAVYYLYMFRDNIESAQLALNTFQQGIAKMRTKLINKYDRLRDTRSQQHVTYRT